MIAREKLKPLIRDDSVQLRYTRRGLSRDLFFSAYAAELKPRGYEQRVRSDHGYVAAYRGRGLWNLLAGVWGLWGCGPGGWVPKPRHRFCRRLSRLRLDGSDHGLRRRAYLRGSF